jgi:hypothetical protein
MEKKKKRKKTSSVNVETRNIRFLAFPISHKMAMVEWYEDPPALHLL